MGTALNTLGRTNPVLAGYIKGYDKAEIDKLIEYSAQAIAWLDGVSISTDDVVSLRVGIPYLGRFETVEATEVYTANGNSTQVITSLGVDVLKVTTRVYNKDSDRLLHSYTYKSKYIHKIFGNYFYDGVYNISGLSYMDGVDVLHTKNATVPVRYDDTDQILPIVPDNVPDCVVNCVQYMVQNPGLLGTIVDGDAEKHGDMVHMNGIQFRKWILDAAQKAATKFPVVTEEELPTDREEAIRLVLETTGLHESFKALDMGGTLSTMRVLMRIPASRANQEALEGLLTSGDVFSNVFKEMWVPHTEKELEEHSRSTELNDPYNTDKTVEYNRLDDVYNGYYGCSREYTHQVENGEGDLVDEVGTECRYWYVNEAWLKGSTAERLAVVFWMGLDLTSTRSNPCPYDTLLIIIIIIVVTISTAGLGTAQTAATGLSLTQTLAVVSAVISIGVTTGAIDSKTGAILNAIMAVATLGTSLAANALPQLASTATVQLTVQIANTALTVVSTIETLEFMDDMEKLEKAEQELLDNNPEFYESQIRFTLGGYQDKHISEGCQIDYEKNYHDMYDRYSVYTDSGFM